LPGRRAYSSSSATIARLVIILQGIADKDGAIYGTAGDVGWSCIKWQEMSSQKKVVGKGLATGMGSYL